MRRRLGLVLIVVAMAAIGSYAFARSPSTPKASGWTSYAPGGPQSGSLGSLGGYQRQELSYIRAADQKVFRTPACRNRGPAVPLVSHGSPSGALRSALGVLRRPATAADRLPHSLQSAGDARGIYVDYIRLARVKNGVSYYIVPAASLSPGRMLPAGCYAAMVAALRAELPQIPVRLRAPTLSLQGKLIARQRRFAKQAAAGGICLMFNSPKVSGGACGATASEIKQRGMLSSFGPLSGVVPDGVATVTIHYPASNGLAARTVASDIVGNVFLTSIRRSNRGDLGPAVIWRSAQGKIIKTVPASRGNHGPSSGFCSAPVSNAC